MRKLWSLFKQLSTIKKLVYSACVFLVAAGVICSTVLLTIGDDNSPILAGNPLSSESTGSIPQSPNTSTTVTSQPIQTLSSLPVSSTPASSAMPESSATTVTSRPTSSKPPISSTVTTSIPTSSDTISTHSKNLMAMLNMESAVYPFQDRILAFKEHDEMGSVYCGTHDGLPYFWLSIPIVENKRQRSAAALFYYTEQDGFVPTYVLDDTTVWFARIYKGKLYYLMPDFHKNTVELWCVDLNGQNLTLLQVYPREKRTYVDGVCALQENGNLYTWFKHNESEQFLVRINLNTYAFETVAQVNKGFESRIYLTESKIYTVLLIRNERCIIHSLNYDGSQIEEWEYSNLPGVTEENCNDVWWHAADEGLFYMVGEQTYFIDAASKTIWGIF